MNNFLFPQLVRQQKSKRKGNKVKIKKTKPKNLRPKPLSFSQLINQVTKQTNTLAKRISDFDGDGVPNWKDCQPLNPKKQDRKLTYEDFEFIKEELNRGRKASELITYSEFAAFTKAQITRTPFVKVVGGYGIFRKDGLYHALDMKTGLLILRNGETIDEIIDDIKGGVPERLMKEQPYKFSVRAMYKVCDQTPIRKEKHGGKAKRFKKIIGQKVLDVGAGSNPDLRATHAIDLKKPLWTFKDLSYRWGYDFNKETTNLPYSSNSFDVVVSIGSLGRNFESEKIYREIYRVLKPGGRVEISQSSNVEYYLRKVGFEKPRMQSYFDDSLNKRISVIVARKA